MPADEPVRIHSLQARRGSCARSDQALRPPAQMDASAPSPTTDIRSVGGGGIASKFGGGPTGGRTGDGGCNGGNVIDRDGGRS